MSKQNKIGSRAKPLAAAIALGMGAAALAPQALAVNVSQNGLGEVLLFPYYTVRNNYDTYVNVTNTSENTVVFKIRFREGHNSRDVRDFNVVLSPYDVWTAVVTESDDGTVAQIRTSDNTCTVGQLPDLGNGQRGIDFTNYDYSGANADTGPADLDRTKEGHIEIIEMGHQKPLNPGAASPDLRFTDGTVGYNAQHVNGVPRNCDAVESALTTEAAVEETNQYFYEPINVLKGAATLIKVDEGKSMSYDPTVLANFSNPLAPYVDDTAGLDSAFLYPPTDENPTLALVQPPIAEVIDNAVDNTVVDEFFARPVDAVSAVLSRETVLNQFSINPANNAATDWVVTFPTKHYYVDERYVDDTLVPFEASDTFQADPADCAAVEVTFRFFNREEGELTAASQPGFSPRPPGAPANTICRETQVITFGETNVFGAAQVANVDVRRANFNNGWMRLVFPQAGTLVGEANGWTFHGLPVTGFAATTLENGTNANAILNYGMLWSHSYATDLQRLPTN